MLAAALTIAALNYPRHWAAEVTFVSREIKQWCNMIRNHMALAERPGARGSDKQDLLDGVVRFKDELLANLSTYRQLCPNAPLTRFLRVGISP